jgi:hypothetical protein
MNHDKSLKFNNRNKVVKFSKFEMCGCSCVGYDNVIVCYIGTNVSAVPVASIIYAEGEDNRFLRNVTSPPRYKPFQHKNFKKFLFCDGESL